MKKVVFNWAFVEVFLWKNRKEKKQTQVDDVEIKWKTRKKKPQVKLKIRTHSKVRTNVPCKKTLRGACTYQDLVEEKVVLVVVVVGIQTVYRWEKKKKEEKRRRERHERGTFELSRAVREKEGRNSILQSKGNRRSDSIAFFQTLLVRRVVATTHTHTHTHSNFCLSVTKRITNCELCPSL